MENAGGLFWGSYVGVFVSGSALICGVFHFFSNLFRNSNKSGQAYESILKRFAQLRNTRGRERKEKGERSCSCQDLSRRIRSPPPRNLFEGTGRNRGRPVTGGGGGAWARVP